MVIYVSQAGYNNEKYYEEWAFDNKDDKAAVILKMKE